MIVDIDYFEYCVIDDINSEICGIFTSEEKAKEFARLKPEYEYKDYLYINFSKPDISFEV